MRGTLARVLAEIGVERAAQDARWGMQEFPDGSGPGFRAEAEAAKRACAEAWRQGELTWRHILTEEFYEALAEQDPRKLRTELVQTAAVAVKWVESLDRRCGVMPHEIGSGEQQGEKLVRDRIPEIIEAAGGRAETRTADGPQYRALLKAKLYEEAGEYAASADPQELADILEVVLALAAAHGLSPAELERMRADKAQARGGFGDGVVLREPRPLPDLTPQVRHAVRALLLDEQDRLVLVRRAKPGRGPYWTAPGGEIEPGDEDAEAALRRELDEELGARVGPLRQVFTYAEQTLGPHYLSTFYLCRLVSMDPGRRHGPEFTDPATGGFDVDRVPCDPAAIAAIDLFPPPLAAFLQAHAADLTAG